MKTQGILKIYYRYIYIYINILYIYIDSWPDCNITGILNGILEVDLMVTISY